jgi:hypothetical protein
MLQNQWVGWRPLRRFLEKGLGVAAQCPDSPLFVAEVTTIGVERFSHPSQLLQSKRSELVYDWRANAFIANKCNFRHCKSADNVTGDD